MAGPSRVAAVTFDLWNTLLWELPDQLRDHRLGHWESVLAEGAVVLAPGTLARAHDAAFAAYQAAWHANEQYVTEHAMEEMLAVLGPAVTPSLCERLAEGFSQAGRTADIRPTPGVVECLRALADAGMLLGVVCDIGLTPSPVVVELLERHGLADYFKGAFSFSDIAGRYKPDPAAFLHCLEQLGVEPDRAAHVGDRQRTDVAGARALGMATVRYRAIYDEPPPPGMADADLVIDHFDALSAWLTGGTQRNGDRP